MPMPDVSLTPVVLQSVAGVLLSLLFSYVPGLRLWFAALGAEDPNDTGERKRLVMLGLLAVVWLAMIALDYGKVLPLGLAYDRQGWFVTVWALILSIVSNQGAYSITPQAKDVRAAKALGVAVDSNAEPPQ